MINRIVLTGRLVDDPEDKTFGDTAITKFRIAVDRVRKGREGDPDADFFNIVCFGRTAEFVNRYLHKGDLVGVDGRLHLNPYEDRDGNRRTWVEVAADNVQSLAKAGDGGGRQRDDDRDSDPPKRQRPARADDRRFTDDDDDPFGEE